jgi:hypothetical protein
VQAYDNQIFSLSLNERNIVIWIFLNGWRPALLDGVEVLPNKDYRLEEINIKGKAFRRIDSRLHCVMSVIKLIKKCWQILSLTDSVRCYVYQEGGKFSLMPQLVSKFLLNKTFFVRRCSAKPRWLWWNTYTWTGLETSSNVFTGIKNKFGC